MKKVLLGVITLSLFVLSAFTTVQSKLVSKDTHINFYSHTSVEDITADNYKVVSTLDPSTGNLVFSVPMQSFEFEKSLMQKHYNSKKFLDTKTYPKSKFIGKIENVDQIDFATDGTYEATVTGKLTIKDKTNPINEKISITVGEGKVSLNTKMKLTLGDYGVTFSGGKPSENIAKELDLTVKAVYAN